MSRDRTTRLLPAALAALALVLGACGSSDSADDDAAGRAAPDSASATSEPGATATTELTLDPAAETGRCMVPNAEALATQTTAFEGTVVALGDDTATLEVDRWYTDGTADRVTVATPDLDGLALEVDVDFEEGRTYLVSAVGDRVSLCGFTAEKTPELEALYAEAFGS